MDMKRIAVFLGSSEGSEQYMRSAYDLGHSLAEKGYGIVFGGAEVGTMKAFADGVLDAGGSITGVFPKGFGGKREVAATGRKIVNERLTELIEVRDFAERKDVMNGLSDCCLILPGSFGTLDELFCLAVGNEIGLHDKRAFVANFNGYYDGLELQIKTMKREHFLKESDDTVVFVHTVDELFEALGR